MNKKIVFVLIVSSSVISCINRAKNTSQVLNAMDSSRLAAELHKTAFEIYNNNWSLLELSDRKDTLAKMIRLIDSSIALLPNHVSNYKLKFLLLKDSLSYEKQLIYINKILTLEPFDLEHIIVGIDLAVTNSDTSTVRKLLSDVLANEKLCSKIQEIPEVYCYFKFILTTNPRNCDDSIIEDWRSSNINIDKAREFIRHLSLDKTLFGNINCILH